MTKKTIFDTQVLGHPAGLFVLFFTEMWERFFILWNACTAHQLSYDDAYRV